MRNVLVVPLFFICSIGCSQTKKESIRYHFPFDSVSIVKHQTAINLGQNYLVLAKSNWPNKSYYLLSTGWYELPNKTRSYASVDSLLQGTFEEPELTMTPIPESLLSIYNGISDCDLIKLLFTNEGYFKRARFFTGQNVILAELIRRGFKIELSDYDGEPFFDRSSIDCK